MMAWEVRGKKILLRVGGFVVCLITTLAIKNKLSLLLVFIGRKKK